MALALSGYSQTYFFFSGSPGEASTGLAVDLNADGVPDRILAGDNEDETLRFYPVNGGAPSESLQLTAVSPAALTHTSEAGAEANAPGVIPNRLQMIRVNRVVNRSGADDDWEIREADLEASARIGNTIYWLGSHSRAANLNERQNRFRLFATTLSVNGGVPSLTFVNYYSILRDQLIAWDNARPIARRYDLQTAANPGGGSGPNPESDSGFNLEGMTQTEAGTLFIGFRAPLVDPYRYSDGGLPTQVHRTHAIVMEISNPAALIAAAGSPPSTTPITVGRTYELDLGGRGIRSMDFNGTDYVILAGRVATIGQTDDFAIFTWRPGTEPILRYANIPLGFTAETVIILTPGSLSGTFNVRLLEDFGANDNDRRIPIPTSFRGFDAAIPGVEQAFQFATIADVMVHQSALGAQRQVDVVGFEGTGGNLPTLQAFIISGSTLVPSLTVVQPTVSIPNGALLFTPAAGSPENSALIRVTATLPGPLNFTRDFRVYKFSTYRHDVIATAPPNGVHATRLNHQGSALGVLYGNPNAPYYGTPVTWNQRNAFTPANDLLPTPGPTFVDGFNDFGTTVGNQSVWLNGNQGPYPLSVGLPVERLFAVNNRNQVLLSLDGDQVPERWRVADLTGTVSGGFALASALHTLDMEDHPSSDVVDIDRYGDCGGYIYQGDVARATIWTRPGGYSGPILLPLQGAGDMSQVFALSPNGIAGGYQTGNPEISRACIWRRDSANSWATPILFPQNHAYVFAVNDDRQAAVQNWDGISSQLFRVCDGALTGSPVIWDFRGTDTEVPTNIGLGCLNNRGQVIAFFAGSLRSKIYTPVITN